MLDTLTTVETLLGDAIDIYTLRCVLHGLANVCYERSERASRLALTFDPDAPGRVDLYARADDWQAVGQRVARSAEIAKAALL